MVKLANNHFIKVVSCEIADIKKRWNITSDRQLSSLLCMSPRTISKVTNQDGTLSIDSLLKIFLRLIYIRCLIFSDEEMIHEERRLIFSLLSILNILYPIPDKLKNAVFNALEHQMKLEKL